MPITYLNYGFIVGAAASCSFAVTSLMHFEHSLIYVVIMDSNSWTVIELKSLLKQNNLPTIGVKAKFIQKLTEFNLDIRTELKE